MPTTIQIDKNLGSILEQEQANPEFILKEFLLIDILSKKEKYLLEVKKFEYKYHATYSDFEKKIHSKENEEDFEIEEDLMDWEFAIKSLQVLQQNLAKIRKSHDF